MSVISVFICGHLYHLCGLWTSGPYGIVQCEAVYCNVKPCCEAVLWSDDVLSSFFWLYFLLTVHLPDMALDGYLTIYTVMWYWALYCSYCFHLGFSASPHYIYHILFLVLFCDMHVYLICVGMWVMYVFHKTHHFGPNSKFAVYRISAFYLSACLCVLCDFSFLFGFIPYIFPNLLYMTLFIPIFQGFAHFL